MRYFFEQKPELAVVAAGSLLEFVLAEHSFSMPVGRIEYLFLEPMGFQEFLQATGDDDLLALLSGFSWGDQFPISAQERLLVRLREYLLVGGMPESVRVFQETGQIAEAQRVHASILNTWRDDFAKYSTRAQRSVLQKVFAFVPGHVGEKMKYSNIDRDEKSRALKQAVELLSDARIVRRVFHSEGAGAPLGATIKDTVYKTYFLDVGLVNSACGIGRIPQESIKEDRFINEGGLAEQFIAQHLPLLQKSYDYYTPTYWLREGRANNAEVDFLYQLGARVLPIEIKAGKSGTLKSLIEFMHLKNGDTAVRFDLNPPSVMPVSHTRTRGKAGQPTEFKLYSLPLYLIEQLPRLMG